MDGNEIRKKREHLGLTQSELAVLIGVSLRTIQNYEKDGVIPSSKSEILHSVLNTGKIKIKGDGNVSNSGITGGDFIMGSDQEVQDLKKRIKELESEVKELKNDKVILQEFVTVLQNKK